MTMRCAGTLAVEAAVAAVAALVEAVEAAVRSLGQSAGRVTPVL